MQIQRFRKYYTNTQFPTALLTNEEPIQNGNLLSYTAQSWT